MPSAAESGPEPQPADSARMFPLAGNSRVGTSYSMAEYLKEDGNRGTPCLTSRALVLKNRLASLLKLLSGPTRAPGPAIGLNTV